MINYYAKSAAFRTFRYVHSNIMYVYLAVIGWL